MVELDAAAPYVVGRVKKFTFLRQIYLLSTDFYGVNYVELRTAYTNFKTYHGLWVGTKHGIGGQWTNEQVRQKCVTFALIATVNKGSELYIYIHSL